MILTKILHDNTALQNFRLTSLINDKQIKSASTMTSWLWIRLLQDLDVRIEGIFILSKTKKIPTLLSLPNDLEMIAEADNLIWSLNKHGSLFKFESNQS